MTQSTLENIGGLKPSNDFLVDEQVVMFLQILAHHVRNRVIEFEFGRSRKTISRYFYLVLNAMMWLHGELLKVPKPIGENSTNEKWKWFKGYGGPKVSRGEGFLAPYRGQRYHLNERRDGYQPNNLSEYFDMMHSGARNRYNVEEPLEDEMDEDDEEVAPIDENNPILTMETSDAWSNWRDALAAEMFNEFKRGQG
ncbi:hypothetical protein L6164_005861 [Bauhinia variegata]|uniref:Uncharacterized protein n=1 Tax=Bauhinia variegata TaxID=167791 RepID=A0ACB9PT29_BAUVA|nr:hypothetical protein L6164_005861 [Bauhinia variegata]